MLGRGHRPGAPPSSSRRSGCAIVQGQSRQEGEGSVKQEAKDVR